MRSQRNIKSSPSWMVNCALLLLLLGISPSIVVTANDVTSSSYPRSSCDPTVDTIRLYGGSGDAGRVELCHDSKWRYVCSSTASSSPSTPSVWNTTNAALVACKQLGHKTARMAELANDMAMGETVDSGVDPSDGGMRILSCKGHEEDLKECEWIVDSKCQIDEAVGAACTSAPPPGFYGDETGTAEQKARIIMDEMWEWEKMIQATFQMKISNARNDEIRMEGKTCQSAGDDTCTTTKEPKNYVVPDGIPNALHDMELIKSAFLYPEGVSETYSDLRERFSLFVSPSNVSKNEDDLSKALPKLQWNAYGVNLANFFSSSSTEEVKDKLLNSPDLASIYDIYLSSNAHNAIHYYLDSPYRYRTAAPSNLDAKTAEKFEILQRDGIVMFDDFGGDINAIIEQAMASVTGPVHLKLKNETIASSGGAVITSRIPIAPLEDLLLRDPTIKALVEAYQGPSMLHGYKTTRMTSVLESVSQYNAGAYHHDRVGRRLKLFLFLHDVDCTEGHPTRVAAGTNNVLYYRTEAYPSTRFDDDYVQSNYKIIQACGKKGGGFLFDTHTLHKGTVEGKDERTVVIAEYHNVAKCSFSHESGFGLPCPGGDMYRVDAPLP
uniref:SRCR domain-containing protein n=2 Tax=Ditylum brightwellii TaxID=49249 RepID=A0A6U3TEL4_9STRA|mmetsp:Transcript_28202/g.40872  ORF Transcript_28202/g.40872 Transcript_28202/m.40872 type:complete len:608 (-) Transcript_28202:206-2029(-)